MRLFPNTRKDVPANLTRCFSFRDDIADGPEKAFDLGVRVGPAVTQRCLIECLFVFVPLSQFSQA